MSENDVIVLDGGETRIELQPERGGRWVSWRAGEVELFGGFGPDPRPLRIDAAGHAGPLIAPGLGPSGPAGMIDHFMPLTAFQSDFAAGRAKELGSFASGAFEYVRYEIGGGWEAALQADGTLQGARRPVPVRLLKKITLGSGGGEIAVHYRLENPSERPLQISFGVEFTFALAGGLSGWYEIDGQREGGGFEARGLAPSVTSAALIEPQPGVAVRMGWEREASIWVCPFPAGATGEEIRGATIMPVWDLRVPPDDNWAVGLWLQAGKSGPVAPIPQEVVNRIQRYESEDEPWKTAK